MIVPVGAPPEARRRPPPVGQALEWATDPAAAARLRALRWQVRAGWVTDGLVVQEAPA